MTGTRRSAQIRTTSCTSPLACGKTTASGGWLAIQVVVLACCSRTACEVTTRLPKRAASALMTAAIVVGLRGRERDSATDIVVAIGVGGFPPLQVTHHGSG